MDGWTEGVGYGSWGVWLARVTTDVTTLPDVTDMLGMLSGAGRWPTDSCLELVGWLQ